MHIRTTIVAAVASLSFTGTGFAQVTFEFTNSGQSLGDSRSRSVALGDLDGDGDLDFITTNNDTKIDGFNGLAYGSSRLEWFENLGIPGQASFVVHTIASVGGASNRQRRQGSPPAGCKNKCALKPVIAPYTRGR